MCTFTYFHVVQSDEKKISWMRSRSKIETFSPSNDLASEESIGLPAAPTIPGPSLSRLKVFLEEKGFKVSSFHLHFPSLCFCVSARARPLCSVLICLLWPKNFFAGSTI
jgi:hypothetical protein